MKRRDFLKVTALAGLGISTGNLFDCFSYNVFASDFVDIAVAEGPSPSGITSAAINALGGSPVLYPGGMRLSSSRISPGTDGLNKRLRQTPRWSPHW